MSDPSGAEQTVTKPCAVCGDPVPTLAETPDDEVLCIVHFFTEDVSAEWESDD